MPRRWAVVAELDYLGLLPGITFIFSRNGCDQAVDQCLNAGLELTTEDEGAAYPPHASMRWSTAS